MMPKKVLKFQNKYHIDRFGSFSKISKKIEKIRISYQQIISENPEWEFFANCIYGTILYNSNLKGANGETATYFLEKGISKWPDKHLETKAFYMQELAKANITGVEKDEKKAFEFFRQAQELCPRHSSDIAFCYLLGIGTNIDISKAESCFLNNYKNINEIWRKQANYQMVYAIEFNKQLPQNSQVLKNYYCGLKALLADKTEEAKAYFLKASYEGHLPSLYMLGEHKVASEKAYTPSTFSYHYNKLGSGLGFIFDTIGRQQEANHYADFLKLANEGYPPAIALIEQYNIGNYAIENNLIGDVAKGLQTVNNTINQLKGQTTQHMPNVTSSSSNQIISTQISEHTSSSSHIDESIYKERLRRYKREEKNAEYWIKQFNEHEAWLNVNKKNKNADIQKFRSYERLKLNDLKQLKFILHQLEQNRTESLSLGGKAIPIGIIEIQVKQCINSSI